MAFKTAITLANGKFLENAYIRASIQSANKQRTIIRLEVWDSEELRSQIQIPFRFETRVIQTTTAQVEKYNLIALAYQLLEESGEFPKAIWNV